MSAKKLSRDQKRKQRKQKRAQHQKQATLSSQYRPMLRRLQEAGWGDQKIVYNPPGYDKMSAVLLDFIRPYYEYATTTEAMHKLITTALVAWNTALLPEAEQDESLQQVSQALPAEVVEDFYAIVREMIERKNKYYAQYKRHILDYTLTETEDNYHVSVISIVDPEESDRFE